MSTSLLHEVNPDVRLQPDEATQTFPEFRHRVKSDHRQLADNPTEFFEESSHPLAEMYRDRVEQQRDLTVLITDSSNDRGTGKTTEALRLISGMDRTEEGITEEKVTLSAQPLTQSYTSLPKGSGLALDESEVGVDKYRAGSSINKAIRELVSMGRIMEKYLVLNAPGDHLIDGDLKSLVDVWVLVERRGFANVYRMDWSPHQGHELTRHIGTLEWNPIEPGTDLHSIYEYISDEKDKRLRGEGDGDEYIKRSEAEEMVKKAKQEMATKKRNEMIQEMVNEGLTQKRTSDIVGLSPSAVSKIVN